MKLLIIDDNAEMRRLIRSLLEEQAEEIFECSDGSQAFAAYSRHRPDWVLMDVEMPQMDGITASRAVRSAFPAARIVIVTKYDDEEMKAEAAQAGACGYVIKEDLSRLRGLLAAA
jgi:CheY-like chemotaxis protein